MSLTNFTPKATPQADASTSDDSTTDGERSFFDLHTRGIGYLSRYRLVTPKGGGKAYAAVNVAAMEGPKSEPSFSYFDAIIAGEVAGQLCKELEQAINDRETKVLVGFTVGGVNPEIYQVAKGPNQGENRVSLKTRLLRIAFVRIKEAGSQQYEEIYKAPKHDGGDEQGDQQAAA